MIERYIFIGFLSSIDENILIKKNVVTATRLQENREKTSQATDDRTQFMEIALFSNSEKDVIFLFCTCFISLQFTALTRSNPVKILFGVDSMALCFAFRQKSCTYSRNTVLCWVCHISFCISFRCALKWKKLQTSQNLWVFLWEKAFIPTCSFGRYIAQKSRLNEEGTEKHWNGCAERKWRLHRRLDKLPIQSSIRCEIKCANYDWPAHSSEHFNNLIWAIENEHQKKVSLDADGGGWRRPIVIISQICTFKNQNGME